MAYVARIRKPKLSNALRKANLLQLTRAPRYPRRSGLGELIPPTTAGDSGTTLLDIGKQLITAATTAYFARKGINPEQYAPTVKLQVQNPEIQAQAQRAVDLGRNLLIVGGAVGAGVLLYSLSGSGKRRR